MHRRTILFAGPALMLPIPARAADPAITPAVTPAVTPAITIDNFTFAPAVLTVKPGEKVVWTNHDDMPHSVVSAATPPLFKSHPLDTDDSFSVAFDKPGTYDYFCGLHPHMHGTVVVK